MADGSSGEKTEMPTPKRLRDAGEGAGLRQP